MRYSLKWCERKSELVFYRTQVHYEFRCRCLGVVCKKSVLKNLRKSTYWIYYTIICLLYIKFHKNQVSCRVYITFDLKTLFQHLIRTVNVGGRGGGAEGARPPHPPPPPARPPPLSPSPTILAFFSKRATKNDIEMRVCSQKCDVPHANSSMNFIL